jgi:hypothetical protein
MNATIDNKDERMWGMLCHLSALSGCIIPFGNIIGPLIVYSIKKDEYAFVTDQGKESLNFQISILIYLFVGGVISIFFVGFFLIIALALVALILSVVASVRANDGEYYRYPMSIKFIQ